MLHKLIRSFILISALFMVTAGRLSAQPCADTQPVIIGSQVVTNNQTGVIYSTPNIPGHTYIWTISGGAIIGGAGTSQVTVTWGAVGTGSITVMETNPLVPCSTSVSKTISVQPLLISYFYYTNTSCYGDVVSFWDASVADAAFPITNYFWTFGDGGTSTLKNPQHQYLPPYNITYPVRLIVTNSIGYNDTIYDAVYVNPDQYIPNAVFTYTVPNCTYDPVVFDCSGSTTPPGTTRIEEWDWDFGDGSPLLRIKQPNNPNISHVYASPGTYKVVLKVINFTSCTDTVSHMVVITPSVPTAQYVFSSPSCLYNPVYFTNQSTSPAGHNMVSWEWNYGDGSMPVVINAPASPDVMHIFPGLGPYHVQLKATNDLGCSDSTFKNVSLDPSPLANFSWDSKCFGDTIKFENLTLQNNGPAIASYLWNFGDPGSGYNTSTQTNPSHVFSTTGTFDVVLQAVNTSGCPDTIIKHLIMFPPPTCDYTWAYGSINQQILFHIDSSSTDWGAIGNMVLWNFGDGTYGYGWNPIHTYPTGGTFDVTLTVTDTIGCHGSVIKQIFIPALPMAFFSSDSPVCDGDSVHFTDLSNAATPPFGYIERWIWDFGDGTPQDTINFPNDPNVRHLYANADTFAVTLKVFDNYGFNDSFTTNVIVLATPVANFFYSSTLCPDQIVYFMDASFPNGGGNIISWSWNFDDPGSGLQNNSNLVNPTHVFDFGDSTYYVRLIVVNFNNCTDTMIKPVYIHPKPRVDFTFDTACLNQLVHFQADTVVTQLDSIATWLWDFGDGTPAVTDPINTAHMYSAVGIYTVTLTVTDIHGCMNFITHTVQVNPLPVAAFTWDVPVCQNSPVQYKNQSYVSGIYSGYIVKWLWDFGDGTTQTVVLPASPDVTHTFVGVALIHTVRLTVWTNDSCTSYVENIITSTPKPIANFDYSTVSCSGQPVQFTDQSQTNGGGNIASWSWNFGDPGSGVSNFSPLQNPAHNYVASGTYFVKLTVTNANNCFDTITKTVIVNVKPVANFSADTACFNNPTTFTDLSIPNASSIISYSWNFGDATPPNTQPNPVHTYGNYGLFWVTLTIVNSNGCTHSFTKQVLVNPLPTAAYNFTSPNCQGTPVCFTDMSTTPAGYLGNIVRWVWDYGDGFTQTVLFPANPNVCHTFAGTALTHIVRLTVYTSDSCSHYTEHTVTSVPSPIANFGFSTTNCVGQIVQFNDLSQLNGGGPIISWNWNFGDPTSGLQNTSTLQNPTHTFATGNTFTVTLIINNITNCKDTIIKTITINQLPVANFRADTVCLGNLTTFTDLSIPNATNIIAWAWNFGDASPINTLPNPVHAYASPGVFTVTLTVTNSNGCIHTISKQVLVNPLPTAAFSFPATTCQGAPVCFVDMSTTPVGYYGNIVRWVWDFGDGSPAQTIWFPTNPNVCHVFAGPTLSHVVRLTVTTSDSCTHFTERTVNSVPSPVANFAWSSITCENTTVLFNDLSQLNGGGPIISWNWNFNDPLSGGGNTSTLQNPGHSFTSAGTYSVTLIINNMSSCPDTIVKPVTVNMLPVANFSADTACVGSLTTFTDLSVPNATSIVYWSWNFGDGSPANTLPNPTYTYPTYGLFNVTLTITNSNGCIHSKTKQVLVLPLPIAAFIYDTPTCQGAVVNYHDMSTTVPGYLGMIMTWQWDFGDGSTTPPILFPNNADISHVFQGTALSHVVRLTVTTANGCTHFIEHTVLSIPSPLANFGYPATNCIGQSVQFTDQSQMNGGGPIVTWNWNFGDPFSGGGNNSNAQSPVHIFSGTGPFDVTLIVSNSSGCNDTIMKTVTISAKPVASFTADTACKGSLTTFTDASTVPAGSGSISAHFWQFGDGWTSTLTNPTHLYGNAGIYNVTLTVTTTHGCTKDTTIQVLVNSVPTAAFQFSSPTCVGDSVQFTDLSTSMSGAIVRWFWEFGDGNTKNILYPDIPNVKHAYSAAGTFNVKLTVTTTDSCTNTKMLPVIIQPKPLANFDYGSTLCEMMPLDFTDLSQPTGGVPIVTWSWDFGDPASGTSNTSPLKNPSHSFSTSGPFDVLLIVTNANGCFDSITKTIDVNAGPVAEFTADTACVNTPTQFTDASTAGSGTLVSWQWDFGDPASGTGNTSTLQNPSHIFGAPGTYYVTLLVTNSNSCERDTVMPITVNPSPEAMFEYAATCVGDSTQFTDLSIAPGSSITDWSWNFGDGGTSLLQNPKHAYAASGTYDVSLTVTNLSGCIDSIVLQVMARPKPVADYIFTNFFCPAGQVMFQDQSQGVGASITERLWTFEPGYTSPLINPVYVFGVTDTTYIVSLIVTDNYGCQDTIYDSVYVKPGFDFTFTHDTVCFGFPMHFYPVNKATGDSLYSPYWEFGDPNSGPSNISYLYNPTHTFSAPGLYVVKFKAVNSDNCVDSVYRVVLIRALPTPAFEFVSTPCDSTIYFTDESATPNGTITTWIWSYGDGSVDTIYAPLTGDTSHLYVNPGFYTVILKIINSNGCFDTVSKVVQRYPCVLASFTYDTALMCARYPISFSDSSLPIDKITQWHWYFGDGSDTVYTTHSGNVVHTYADSGTYVVKLKINATVLAATYTDSLVQYVTIHPTPITYFSNPGVCKNQITLFRDTSNTFGKGITNWNWYFGDPSSVPNDTSTFKNPSHKYDTAGSYDVKLVVMNRWGCQDSLTKTTRVFELPVAHFDNSVACSGNPTNFTDISLITDTTIMAWRWNFGVDGTKKDTSEIQDPIYQYQTDGDYLVRLVVMDHNGCLDTVDSTIRVNITPVSAFTFTDNLNGMTGKIQLNNLSSGASGYEWEFGNGSSSTEENPVATYSMDGTYVIMLISSNEFNCTDTTFYKYEVLFKGLYVPNAFSPTNTNLAVRLFKPVGKNLKQYNIQVYDYYGHLLWESSKLDTEGKPLEGWDGIYNGKLMPQGTYMWKASATFIDDTIWQGSDIGQGEYKTLGTVSLIR